MKPRSAEEIAREVLSSPAPEHWECRRTFISALEKAIAAAIEKARAETIERCAENDAEKESAGACCHDCGRPYGDEHGFPDLIIPFSAWRRISPRGDDSGLLCPSCICKRLHDAGIKCEGAFVSGPIVSVSEPTMNALRRIENIEEGIKGRNNHWGALIRALKEAP